MWQRLEPAVRVPKQESAEPAHVAPTLGDWRGETLAACGR